MILGIDVAKEKVDVVLFQGKQFISSGQFDNTQAGFKKLSAWLKNKGVGQAPLCIDYYISFTVF